ncbi:hypothetical protein EV182_002454, partial [Spiromyces aspiralis]
MSSSDKSVKRRRLSRYAHYEFARESLSCWLGLSSSGSKPSTQGVGVTEKSSGRNKVALEQGHSPMDWVRLKNSGKPLKSTDEFREYTLEEIAKHNKPDDCWVVIHKFVYDVTAYLKFHPG